MRAPAALAAARPAHVCVDSQGHSAQAGSLAMQHAAWDWKISTGACSRTRQSGRGGGGGAAAAVDMK